MIKTIAKPTEKKVTACGECRSTCQSACKTSCTVGNQSCERITREDKIERKSGVGIGKTKEGNGVCSRTPFLTDY